MLDNVRRTVADSLRMLTASEVGDRLPPLKLAKKLAAAFADRLYPADTPREWTDTGAANDSGATGWAGRGNAQNDAKDAGGLVSAAKAQAAAPVKLDLEAGQLRSEMDSGKEYFLVDVREPGETMHGIIPGAKLIPLAQVLERIGEIRDQERPIVIYCAAGNRSRHAAQHLRDRGVERVFNLKGGIDSWYANGGEIVPPAGAVAN